MRMFRVRAQLDRSAPPIWRRFDLSADLPLDVVHLVLQTAFDWENSHLYRFATGGGPFDDDSAHFLCDEDVAEGEEGLPASEVPLEAALRRPGDRLSYVYDYGDHWGVTLDVERVTEEPDDCPGAVLLDGERAAPPEDCGGVTDGSRLAAMLDDPAAFDVESVNNILLGPGFTAITNGVANLLLALIGNLRAGPALSHFAADLALLSTGPTMVDDDVLHTNLTAFQWFLDRAADGGIALTSAGYLRPADVTAACEVLPEMTDWIGKNNREANCAPLLDFRQALQSLGLLRKHKGALVLTRAGVAAQADPRALWRHLAARLVPEDIRSFEHHATLLFLAQAGGTDDGQLHLDVAAQALTELGWRQGDGSSVPDYVIYRLPAHDVLRNVCDRPRRFSDRDWVGPAAAALARAALRRSSPSAQRR